MQQTGCPDGFWHKFSTNEITLLRKLLCTPNLFSMYSRVFSQNLYSPRERLMRADRREQLNHIFKGCAAWHWGGHLCSGLVWSLDHAGFYQYQHNLLQCPSWWESTRPPLADRLPTTTDFSPVCGPHLNTHKSNVAATSPRRTWNHTGGKTQNTNISLLIITKMISVEALRLNLLILIGCMDHIS